MIPKFHATKQHKATPIPFLAGYTRIQGTFHDTHHSTMHTVRVWDLPTRLFHWALVTAVVAQVVTGNLGGNWMNWHFRTGYAVLTLLLFRLVWGFLGGHWSRFGSFLPSPRTLLDYLRGRARPEHQVGHSPLGALSVAALLLLLLAQAGSGLFSDDEIAFFGPLTHLVSGDTVGLATWYHKNLGKAILIVLIALHLLAIAYYKLFKKRALVASMWHGDKTLAAAARPARDDARSRLLALVVLLVCAAVVYQVVSLGSQA